MTGRKGTLAKVTAAGCSGDGGSAERVGSRHSLEGKPTADLIVSAEGWGKVKAKPRAGTMVPQSFARGEGIGGGTLFNSGKMGDQERPLQRWVESPQRVRAGGWLARVHVFG